MSPSDRPHDPQCIFCKIVAGQVPCYRLAQTDQVLAFLDVGPISHGHCLVIPKEHHPRLEQMDPTLAGHCMQMAAKVGKAMIAAVGAVAWNVLQNNGEEAGQVVHHVHFHIIPRGAGDGLGFRWPAGKLDQDEAANLVKAIGALIGNQ